MKYFAFDMNENDFEIFDDEDQAIKFCNDAIDYYKFDDDFLDKDKLDNMIGWGKINQLSECKKIASKKDFTDQEWKDCGYKKDILEIYDCKLVEIK